MLVKLRKTVRAHVYSRIWAFIMIQGIAMLVWIFIAAQFGIADEKRDGTALTLLVAITPPILIASSCLFLHAFWCRRIVERARQQLLHYSDQRLKEWIVSLYFASHENLEFPIVFLPFSFDRYRYRKRFNYKAVVGECPGQLAEQPRFWPTTTLARFLRSLDQWAKQ